ncbi:MAG: hypothetical protein E7195_00805 [Peptococcaceae bacterium]|nr:hypothetical protein [Peptococcaceae bacterium]
MFVKVGGILLLIGAGTAIGFYRAYGFRKRIADIIMLQNAFRLLETEIFYTLTPVPAAMELLEQKLPSPVQHFFHQVWCAVQNEQMSVFQAWEQGIVILEQETFCGREELGAVQSFGLSLGDGDLAAQQKNFQLLQQRLQYALEEAEREKLQQGHMWQYVGVCASMAVAILLC